MGEDTRTKPAAASEYDVRFDMTLREWILHHQKNIVFDQCSWMGVPTLKNPLDAWIYQELIHCVKPDVVLELGSAFGGAALYYAHLLDLLGGGTVVTVDKDASRFRAEHERIVQLEGMTDDPEIVARVQALCAGKRVLAIHDASHLADDVLRDLRTYAGLIGVGSYFIVEDGIMDLCEPEAMGAFKDGPLLAAEAFVRENPDFVVDEACERYLITYNPKGFLKRIS
jgi:cephalosporin hydroxylase